MNTTAIRYNKELTATAKAIFGDIVAKAFTTTWNTTSTKEDVQQRLSSEDRDFIREEIEIDIGATEVWIEFTNGKTVAMQSSEWGTIEPAKVSISYEA